MNSCINADDVSIRYDQTTKIIERFLFDMKSAGASTFWLESCNVCSCAVGVEAVGAKWIAELPKIDGESILSQADILFDFCYSTYGLSLLKNVIDGFYKNENIDNLVVAINKCSTAKAEKRTFATVDLFVAGMADALSRRSAVVFSYLTDYGTGHYNCAVKHDPDTKMFTTYDSWAANKHCKNGGVKEQMSEAFIKARCKNRIRFIEISKGV